LNTNRKEITRAIITYLIVVFSLSAIFYFLYTTAVIAHDKARAMIYITLLMWCPATGAIATSLIYNRNLRGLGWRWAGPGYALLGYCLPICYAGITWCYLVKWIGCDQPGFCVCIFYSVRNYKIPFRRNVFYFCKRGGRGDRMARFFDS